MSIALRSLFILAALAVTWVAGSWVLIVILGIIHGWWWFIPTMGLKTALEITGIVVAYRFVSGFVSEIIRSDNSEE